MVLGYQTAGEAEKYIQGGLVVLNHGWLFGIASQASTLSPERSPLSLQSYQKNRKGGGRRNVHSKLKTETWMLMLTRFPQGESPR